MQAIKVFYSYAHEDKALRDELEKHLMALKRQGLIEQWHDRDISAGKDWEHEIDTNLNKAHIILLLISKNFIHSDYCYGIELSRAIQRCEANEATIISILLRPCDWEELSFSKYQVLPKNEHPISSRYWHNHDEAFLEVAKGIREVVQQFIDLQQMIETGEMQPLSALTKKPKSLPSTIRTRTASTSNKHHTNDNERTLAETGIYEVPIIKKLFPTKRRRTPVYETTQGLKGGSLLYSPQFIARSFSSKEFDRCTKKNSGFALGLYFLADVIALSMLMGNSLGSLKLVWLFIPLALLIFVWGLFNINNQIAIILSLIFSGVWGLIATHYETWQPIAILALVAVLTCFHFFLFRKHEKRGLFTLS
jgi:hypothetical protein